MEGIVVQAKIVSPPEPTLSLEQQQEIVSIISPKPSEPSIEKVQKENGYKAKQWLMDGPGRPKG